MKGANHVTLIFSYYILIHCHHVAAETTTVLGNLNSDGISHSFVSIATTNRLNNVDSVRNKRVHDQYLTDFLSNRLLTTNAGVTWQFNFSQRLTWSVIFKPPDDGCACADVTWNIAISQYYSYFRWYRWKKCRWLYDQRRESLCRLLLSTHPGKFSTNIYVDYFSD